MYSVLIHACNHLMLVYLCLQDQRSSPVEVEYAQVGGAHLPNAPIAMLTLHD